jgi:hypothetical protein
MMVASPMRRAFCAAALVSAAPSTIANAQAVASDPFDSPYLQTGCHPKAQVAQALQAAGQVPIITAYRGIPSRPKNYFSMDSRGRGAQFEETGDELCISFRYISGHLNNDPNVSIPTWAPLRGAASDSFNQFLSAERDERGARVIFGAVAIDENNRPASRVVVTMGRGDEFAVNRGATVAAFANGEYTVPLTLADITPDSRNFPALASNDRNNAEILER